MKPEDIAPTAGFAIELTADGKGTVTRAESYRQLAEAVRNLAPESSPNVKGFEEELMAYVSIFHGYDGSKMVAVRILTEADFRAKNGSVTVN
jgi:hypothetical protein